jgi:hypothetical protein
MPHRKVPDTAIDYYNLIAAASMMGSGGKMSSTRTTAWSTWRSSTSLHVEESCASAPGRVGNKMLEMLEKISDGKATEKDLSRLRELATIIKDTSLCGWGRRRRTPAVHARQRLDEYSRVRDKRCPAEVQALMQYVIDPPSAGRTMSPRSARPAHLGKSRNPMSSTRQMRQVWAGVATCKFGRIPNVA